MTETERIADQLRRAYKGECYYGPGVRPILAGISEGQALARPIAGVHTICELVLHMTAWKNAVADWLEGSTRELSEKENFPHGTDWKTALDGLDTAQERLLAALANLAESRLDERLANHDYSTYFALHGTIQHDVYHAGQILVLARSLA